jgi:FMN-dependent NADH-azoreductase
MKKILHIISSPQGEASVSKKLGNAIIEKIKAKYPDSILKERNLAKKPLPHLDEVLISSFFAPAEKLSKEQIEATKRSDEAIAELQEADILVIDSPMYNFTIASTLKTYLDHIVRRGVTFRATDTGTEGLVKNKKVYLAFSGAGVYSEGALKSYDFVIPLLKTVLGWIGITDVSVFRVEGLRYDGIKEKAFEKGVESIMID